MTIGELGEGETLARIFPLLPESHRTIIGPGDDCAAVSVANGRIAITTDLMIEGPDFHRGISTGFDLGWKACATNLADIAAMGATPTALVVGLAAAPETTVEYVLDIARGLHDAAQALAPGCGVVGGDLSRSPIMMISVTAFGEWEGVEPVIRSGAAVGNRVAVSGVLGNAAKGLRTVLGTVAADGTINTDALAAAWENHASEVMAQLRPSPPIADGIIAARAGATAMMDISDGLVLDARRIADASAVAIDLNLAEVGDIDALTGGEDHALLACFPVNANIPPSFRVIGRVAPGSGVLVDGVPFDAPGGWDPFRDYTARSSQ